MSAGWVAASVRARAMARRRLGLAGVRRLAVAPSLEAARDQLTSTAYADVLTAPAGLAEAQRAIAAAVLWQIRVLAGWMPSAGTTLARIAAAAFERENLVGHLSGLAGVPAPPPFDLGTLTTVWNRVRGTTTPEAALAEIAASPWGEVTPGDLTAVRDELTAAWLRRVALLGPAPQAWACTAAVLLIARIQVLEGRRLAGPAASQLTGLIGPDWTGACSLQDLSAGVYLSARRVLDGVPAPERLWVAEAGLWTTLADDGTRLLRRPIAGPEHTIGAIAVLAADAWRVSAALAAAASGGAGDLEEVLGGVA